MERIDDAVRRILRVKFIAGLFERPFSYRSLLDIVGCQMHRELAWEAVRKSLVLAENGREPRKPFLLLDRTVKRILVAGSHADDLGYQCGGWTATWHGGSGRITIGTTILDAIKEVVGGETEVIHNQYPSPATLAGHDFSYAIPAVGEELYVESLGDNPSLAIPFDGNDVIRAVVEKLPTLVIVVSGRPLVIEPDVLDKIEGLVAAWLPGDQRQGVLQMSYSGITGTKGVCRYNGSEVWTMDANVNSYDPFGLKS